MYELKLEHNADRHLGRILELQAEYNGDTAFLITDADTVTFAEAEDITNRLAAGFTALGVSRGNRVAFLMASRPELVLMCLACRQRRWPYIKGMCSIWLSTSPPRAHFRSCSRHGEWAFACTCAGRCGSRHAWAWSIMKTRLLLLSRNI